VYIFIKKNFVAGLRLPTESQQNGIGFSHVCTYNDKCVDVRKELFSKIKTCPKLKIINLISCNCRKKKPISSFPQNNRHLNTVV
jgi:hypothetical protein